MADLKFHLDINTATAKNFDLLAHEFDLWRKENPPQGPVPLITGWTTITPEIAEECLKRNPLGANRKATFANVVYYAGQMVRNDWPKTGQPIIFNTDGDLLDGQHRLWACYLSQKAFETFVVSDVPARPLLFAYIDNSKARTPANALATAGINGQSSLVTAILKIADLQESGALTIPGVLKHSRMSPVQYVHFAEKHSQVRQAAHLTSGDYGGAVELVAHKDVVGYVTLKILELHDQTAADDFWEDVAAVNEDFGPDSPITALQKASIEDAKRKKPWPRHLVLAHVIKTFNAWKNGEPMPSRRFGIRTTESFPVILGPSEQSTEELEEGFEPVARENEAGTEASAPAE